MTQTLSAQANATTVPSLDHAFRWGAIRFAMRVVAQQLRNDGYKGRLRDDYSHWHTCEHKETSARQATPVQRRFVCYTDEAFSFELLPGNGYDHFIDGHMYPAKDIVVIAGTMQASEDIKQMLMSQLKAIADR